MQHRTPSPFGQWLRQARRAQSLSQSRLGAMAKLHRLQITYLESGRTALPRPDARQRLYEALGQQPAEQTVVESAKHRAPYRRCSFCRAEMAESWFAFVSTAMPRTAMCASCLSVANQQAALAARQKRIRRPQQLAFPQLAVQAFPHAVR